MDLNSMEIKELENLKSLIDAHIEMKKKGERKEKYAKAVRNILSEITVIITECYMGNITAMTIEEGEFLGLENNISISWNDLQNYLNDLLIHLENSLIYGGIK